MKTTGETHPIQKFLVLQMAGSLQRQATGVLLCCAEGVWLTRPF